MKVVILIPYFGRFPNYFQLFLNSCSVNSNYNWVLLTDNEESYQYPENVRKFKMSFDEVKKRIQEKMNFPAAISSYHKLCDYKPAYGYLFPEFIEGYDFWGYGDVDLIYGNLNKFISTDDLKKYDKLFELGHLSLVKNSDANNQLFMREYMGTEYYRTVYMDNANYNFDEEFMGRPNINRLFRQYGKNVCSNGRIADIYTKSSVFKLVKENKNKILIEKKQDSVFYYDGSNVIRYVRQGEHLKKEEYMYIHLQKRKMNIKQNVLHAEKYLIIPNAFVPMEEEITISNFHKIRKRYLNAQYVRIRYFNLKAKVKESKNR